MDKFFEMGRGFMGGSSGGSSGGGGLNPFSIFKQFDRNGDGRITEDDFVSAIQMLGLGSVGDSTVRQVFKQLDRNRNGVLEISEAFRAFETIQGIFSSGGGGGGGANQGMF